MVVEPIRVSVDGYENEGTKPRCVAFKGGGKDNISG